MAEPSFVAQAKTEARQAAEAADVAARHFVYQLYEATRGRPDGWQVLGKIGGGAEAVARAVERGWLIVRDDRFGRIRVQSGLLSEEGRRIGALGDTSMIPLPEQERYGNPYRPTPKPEG